MITKLPRAALSLYGAFAVFGEIALCIESAVSDEVQGVV